MGLKVLASQAAAQRVTSLCRHGGRVWVGFADGVVLIRDAATGNLEGFISGRSDAFIPTSIHSTVSGVLIGYRNGSIRLFPLLPNQSVQGGSKTNMEGNTSTTLYVNVEAIEVLKGFDDGYIASISCARNIVYYVKKGMLYMLDLATRTSVPLEDPFATAASRVTSVLLVSSSVSELIPDSLWAFSTSATGSQSSFSAAVSSSVSQNHLTVIPIDAKTGVADSSQAKKEVIRIPNSFVQGIQDEESTNISSAQPTNRQIKANPQIALANSAVINSAQLSGLPSSHIISVCVSGQIYIWRANDRKLVGWRQASPDLKGACISKPIYLPSSAKGSKVAACGVLALFASDGGVEIIGISQTELKATIASPTSQKNRNMKISTGSSSFSANFSFNPFPATSLFPGSVPVAVETGIPVDVEGASQTDVWRVWVATALSSESTHIMEITAESQLSVSTSTNPKQEGERCRLHSLSSLRILPSTRLFDEVAKKTSVDSKSAIQNALTALNILRKQLSVTEMERDELKAAVGADRSKLVRVEEEVAELTASLSGMDERFEAKLKEDTRIAYEQGQEDANSQIERDIEKMKKEHEDIASASEELTGQVSSLTESLNRKTGEVQVLQQLVDSHVAEIAELNREISELKSQISKLETDSGQQASDTLALQNEVEMLKKEIKRLEDGEQLYQDEVLKLKAELQAKDGSVDEAEVASMKAIITKYEEQIDSLQKELEGQKDAFKALQKKLDENTELIKQLQASHETDQKEIGNLQVQASDQQSAIEKFKEQVSDQQAEIEKLLVQVSDQQIQLEKQKAAQEDISTDVLRENEMLKGEISKLREQLSSSQSQQSQKKIDIEKLNEIIREQKLELSNCQDTMADQRSIIKSLEKEAKDAKESQSGDSIELQDEKTRANKLQAEKDALATQLEFNGMKISTLELMNGNLNEEVQSLKSGMDQIQSEIEDRIYEVKRDQHREWEARLEECVNSLSEVTRSYFELREEYSRAQREINVLKSTQKEDKGKDDDIDSATLPADSEILDNLEDITRQYKSLRQSYTVLESEKLSLKEELESVKRSRVSLEEQIFSIKEALDVTESEKAQLQTTCEQLKEELVSAGELLQKKMVEFESINNQLVEGLEAIEDKVQLIERERDEALASLDKSSSVDAELNEAVLKEHSEAAKALEKFKRDAQVLKLEKEVNAWLPESNIDTSSQIDALHYVSQLNPRILGGTMTSRTSAISSVISDDEEVKVKIEAALKRISNSVESAKKEHKKISEISTAEPGEKKARLLSLMEQINAIGGEGFVLQLKKSPDDKKGDVDSPETVLITTGLAPRTVSDGKSVLEIVHDAAKEYIDNTGKGGNKQLIKVIETDALFIPALNDLNLQLAKLAKENDLVEVIQQELLRLQNLEVVARDAVRQLYVMIRRFENITNLVAVKKSAALTNIHSPLLSPVEAEQLPPMIHSNSLSILRSLKQETGDLPATFKPDPEQLK